MITNVRALQHEKEVHGERNRSGFRQNVFVGSVLVDMYVKCGSIEDAQEVFHKILERDAVSWTAIMAGYVKIEHLGEALKLFSEMLDLGMRLY